MPSFAKKHKYRTKKQTQKYSDMKRIFTTVCLSFATLTMMAQTTLTYKNNGLNAGEYRNMKQIEYMPQGESGANKVWDFSGAKIIKNTYIEQNTNNAEQIGGLNLASSNTLLACDENGDRTSFFEITPEGKKYYGLTSGEVKIEFANPIIDLKFPFAYQEKIGGVMDGTYTTPSSVEEIDGNYVTEADAWGKLILPDGSTYDNVLRIKVTKSYTQVSNTTTWTINTVRYQYFAEGVRYPVLIVLENKVNSNCNCACGKYETEYAYMQPAARNQESIASNGGMKSRVATQKVLDLEVGPNPAHDEITAKITMSENDDNVKVDVVDVSGRKIKDFGTWNCVEGLNSVSLEVSDLVSGNYFIRVTAGKSQLSKSLIKK